MDTDDGRIRTNVAAPAEPECACGVVSWFPFAHAIVVAAIITGGIGVSRAAEVDRLRQEYVEKYGEIEVPEALGFDLLAVERQFPFLVAAIALQFTSLLALCFTWPESKLPMRWVFFTMWIGAWLFLFWPFWPAIKWAVGGSPD